MVGNIVRPELDTEALEGRLEASIILGAFQYLLLRALQPINGAVSEQPGEYRKWYHSFNTWC